MPRQFNAIKPQTPETMTISQLAGFLEKYIDLQFPKNSIDYWSDYPNLKDEPLAPSTRNSFSHVACSVHDGGSEGKRIDMRIILRGDEGRSQKITEVKTFGNSEESWAIARAASEVIEALYLQHSLPILVEFAEALPDKPENMKSKDIKFLLRGFTDSCLDIFVDSSCIATYDFTDKGEAAKYYIDMYHADWKRLAGNLGMGILVDEIEESQSSSNSPSFN